MVAKRAKTSRSTSKPAAKAARKKAPRKTPAAKSKAVAVAPKAKKAPVTGLLKIVQNALEDIKAINVAVLDVRELTDIADTLVIASGTSDRHVRSIADRVVEFAKKAGFRPMGVEGERDGEWVLVDLQDVIVHIMLPRVREFYRLESLWDLSVARREAAGGGSPPFVRLLLLAAGTRLPAWVNEGYEEYASRLRGDYRLELKEIQLGHRGSGATAQSVAKEGERMMAAVPAGAYLVALQVQGRAMSSEQLAAFLQARALDARPLAFCIGGPEGLAPEVDARAEYKWSLSALTLPHGLARVMVAEALYRAVSILKGHPYHRA